MKRRVFALFAALQILCVATSVVSQPRAGFIKPELRGAIDVTDATVSPIRFVPQEVWYDVLLEDPRYGKYKGGYAVINIQWDKDGNLVFTTTNSTAKVLYSVQMEKSEVTEKDTIDPESGRTLKIEYSAKGKGRQLWLIGRYLSPESSVEIEKSAYFDWKNMKMTIVYGKGAGVHRRVIPIVSNSASILTSYAFMMKLKGAEGKIYHFKTFDMLSEKFYDGYLKYEGKREDGKHKFATVPAGWGDQVEMSYWFGPPSEEAPNGRFDKIIIDPIVTRYITMLPVTKEKALAPVTPMVN